MNKFKFIVGIVLMGLCFISCEKDNSEDGNLKIKRIADNPDMENPLFTFEYGSNGLISRITEEYLTHGCLTEITYNSNDKPIIISRKEFSDGSYFSETTKKIGWNDIGFVIYDSDSTDIDDYSLNSQENISSMVSQTKNYSTQKFDTMNVEYYAWTDKNQCHRVLDYEAPWSTEDAYAEYTYKVNNKNSPFKGIDMSILISAIIEIGEWGVDVQNYYCLSEYIESGFSASISYDYNKQNFPTRADISYTSEEGTWHDYLYFEYESN